MHMYVHAQSGMYVPLELKEMGSGYHESFVDA